MVTGSGIDDGIVHVGLAPGREWKDVLTNKFRKYALDEVPGQGGVGGVLVGVPDATARLVAAAVELHVRIEPILPYVEPRSLGELAEIVEVGTEGHARSCFQKLLFIHGSPVRYCCCDRTTSMPAGLQPQACRGGSRPVALLQ